MNKKAYNTVLATLVKLSTEMVEQAGKLEVIFQKILTAVAVTAKCTTEEQARAIADDVANRMHSKVHGDLTKAELKLAETGELEKTGFTKKGKRIGLVEIQGTHTRNAWNLICRAYKNGVAIIDDKGKPRSWHDISSDCSGSSSDSGKPAKAVKMNAKIAEEMKDSILEQLTAIAHDVKRYKGAREGLENGLKGIMESVFGYTFG